jgi:hypothetical protein
MGLALPLIWRGGRSLYDPAVRALAAQQPGHDSTWRDWKRRVSMILEGARDTDLFDNCDAFHFYAMPALEGASIKVDLRNPGQARTVSNGSYDFASFSHIAFTEGGRIDTGLKFANANRHGLLGFYNGAGAAYYSTAVSGARSSATQVQYTIQTSLRRVTARSGPNTNISRPSLNPIGLGGIVRPDNATIRLALAGNCEDIAHPNTGDLLPTGNIILGAIDLDSEASQLIPRSADLVFRNYAPTAGQIATLHELMCDFFDYFEVLAEPEEDAPLGPSWFRRLHSAQVTPSGAKVMVGPTAPPPNDLVDAEPSYYGTGYSRFPAHIAQTRITPRALEWDQTLFEVAGRFWKNRKSLPTKKPNGVDGAPRVNGHPSRQEFDSFDWAFWSTFAEVMSLCGDSPATIIARIQAMGCPVTDTWDTPESNIFTFDYYTVQENADAIFTGTRLGFSTATNRIFLLESALSIVPNGRGTLVRADWEDRHGASPDRFRYEVTTIADYLWYEKGLKLSMGLNALQQSASTGVDRSVMRDLLLHPGIHTLPVTAAARPKDDDMAAHLDRELAFFTGPNGDLPVPEGKISLQWPVGPFARRGETGVALCAAFNAWANANASKIYGYSETPGNAPFGGDHTTPVNRCKSRAYGILLPGDDGYEEDPPPQPTAERDYFFDFGALPPGVDFSRSSVRTAFDADGRLIDFAADTARFDYLWGGTPRGLVIEQGATNLYQRNTEYDNGFWTPNARTKISPVNGRAAPDGLTTMDKLAVATTASGTHAVSNTSAIASDSGSFYCHSAVFDPAENTMFDMTMPGYYAATRRGRFNAVTGAVFFTGVDTLTFMRQISATQFLCGVGSTTAANGASGTSSLTLSLNDGSAISYAGVVDDGLWIWGSQLVECDAMLLPIKTAGSAVTVDADIADLTSVYALTDKAIYCAAQAAYGHGWKKQYLWCFFNDTTAWEAYRDTDATVHVRTLVSGTVTSDINLGAVADGALFAIAARRASGDFAAVINGGSVQASAGVNGGADPGDLTGGAAHLGRDSDDTNFQNRAIARLQHREDATDAGLLAAVAVTDTGFAGFPMEGAA